MTGQPLIFRPRPPGGQALPSRPSLRPLPLCPLTWLRPWFPALAPQWLSLSFAATHSPFIPPAHTRRNPWLAALAAKNIPAILDTSRPYDVIWVPRAQARRAATELTAYELVNAGWPRATPPATASEPLFTHDALCTFIIVQTAIFSFHLRRLQDGRFASWETRGLWNSEAILHGEWWRCLTALTLHADFNHVTANMLWGLIFGTLTASRLGAGLTLLLMLLAGLLGNATMVWLGSAHQSLGASTMVFGLLGILAAIHSLGKWRSRERGQGIIRLIPAVPLAFAVGIAALYGSAPGSDVLAHACGFLWGILLGMAFESLARFRESVPLQLSAAGISILSILLAWQLAWTAGSHPTAILPP